MKGFVINIQIIVDTFRVQGKIFKKMQEIVPKELGIRNKIKIYKATDIKGNFWSIFAITQKSKLLMKDVVKFEEIYVKLSIYCENDFKYKILFIDAPLCSKAKDAFREKGWAIQ